MAAPVFIGTVEDTVEWYVEGASDPEGYLERRRIAALLDGDDAGL